MCARTPGHHQVADGQGASGPTMGKVACTTSNAGRGGEHYFKDMGA